MNKFKKVAKVIIAPKIGQITLRLVDGSEITDTVDHLDEDDWWGGFEGIGDINIWIDDDTNTPAVAVYELRNGVTDTTKWYNPVLEIN
jgi:hypothetical protein